MDSILIRIYEYSGIPVSFATSPFSLPTWDRPTRNSGDPQSPPVFSTKAVLPPTAAALLALDGPPVICRWVEFSWVQPEQNGA